MSDLLICIQPDETGWHSNLCYEAPVLTDGWALVSPEDVPVLRRCGGVVTFTLTEVDPSAFPAVADRRTLRRGEAFPVTAHMQPGVYTAPEQPQPAPSLQQQVSALQTEKADRSEVQALWDHTAGAYQEGVGQA